MPVHLNENEDYSSENFLSKITDVDLGTEENPVVNIAKSSLETPYSNDDQPKSNSQSYSASELNDPNRITVTVVDPNAPLIVLFGPKSCGKTMTLVRMARFLQNEGYIVQPIRTFRPTYDKKYVEICDNFNTTINSDDAAKANDRINFMLVEVIKNGRCLCQILEAPGEFYFDHEKPNSPFPNYVNTIIGNNNRKIWTIVVEPDWYEMEDRRNYVTKITDLKRHMRAKDDVVFLFNKIDKTRYVRKVGDVNVSGAIAEVKNLYPNIFTPFLNQNPITRLWKKYNCDFVPFQTGTFPLTANLVKTYQEGPNEYCKHLWSAWRKKIFG